MKQGRVIALCKNSLSGKCSRFPEIEKSEKHFFTAGFTRKKKSKRQGSLITQSITQMAGIDLDALAASVTKQGSLVRQMKKDGEPSTDLKVAVDALKALKVSLDEAQKAADLLDSSSSNFIRKNFDEMLVRKFFVVPSFEIHGGVGGLYDLGPPGSALKTNIVNIWRSHFVLAESMLEMECTNLTPENVLKTSGHVDRFTDLMVKDLETGECYRADKLLEDAIDNLLESDEGKVMSEATKDEHLKVQRQADAFTPKELGDLLVTYKVKTIGGKDFGEPFPFNLMFRTLIGPEGTSVGYLRPETAQGECHKAENFARPHPLTSTSTSTPRRPVRQLQTFDRVQCGANALRRRPGWPWV